MKPLNSIEIDALVADCSLGLGAEAQDIMGSLDCCVLKLWSDGLKYLVFHTKGNAPVFFITEDRTLLSGEYLKRADKKPLFLFYRTHFKGSTLKEVRRAFKFGRLVEFVFTNEEQKELIIEFRLFPGGVNLGLRLEGKSVFLNKPQPLVEIEEEYTPNLIRSPEVIKEEWVKKSAGSKRSDKDDSSILEEKVRKARSKIFEALEFLRTDPHRRFAETLEKNEELPEDLKKLFRDTLSIRENIEWAYAQQKENELKVERLESRLKDLDASFKKDKLNLQKKSRADIGNLKATRHLNLSEDVRAFCGKTAKENLDLLRKSKSWHLWMHLKDYPSGHLILSIPKSHQVTEGELRKSALFLFKVAAPKRLHAAEQVKFEIIFTETKFVKPIKGAKKGLVQPSRTKSRVFVWNKSENLSF